MREVGGPLVLSVVSTLPIVVLIGACLVKRYTLPGGAALALGTLIMGINVWYVVAHTQLHDTIDWGHLRPMVAAVMGSAVIFVAVLGARGRLTRRVLYFAGAALMAPVAPQMFWSFPGGILFVPLGSVLLIFLALLNPRLRLLPWESST